MLFVFFDKILNLESFSKNKFSSYNKILKKIDNIHSKETFYESLIVEFSNNKIFNKDLSAPLFNYTEYADNDLSFEEWMMSVDFNTYLTDIQCYDVSKYLQVKFIAL